MEILESGFNQGETSYEEIYFLAGGFIFHYRLRIWRGRSYLPSQRQAYYNRGNAKQAKDDLYGALADYSKAIELNSTYAKAYGNRGIVRIKKGNMDGALADFTKAIDLNPNDANAYFGLGIVKTAKGDIDGAKADYTKALKLKPGFSEAQKQLDELNKK
jgi:tetratricopeptide (TPR) repeat protein